MDDMREAVFLAYAALLSNDEDMRDLVVTENLVRYLVQALDNTVKAVSKCSKKLLGNESAWLWKTRYVWFAFYITSNFLNLELLYSVLFNGNSWCGWFGIHMLVPNRDLKLPNRNQLN